MKKINVLLVSLLFVLSGVFVGCSKDEDEDTGFTNPTVDVTYKIADAATWTAAADGSTVTGTEGAEVKFSVKFTMGDAGDKLTKVVITGVISGKTITYADTILNSGWLNSGDKSLTYTASTSIGAAQEIITFSTTDKGGRTGKAAITVKPAAVAGEIKTTTAIIIGNNSNSTLGSFYSLSLNKVMKMLEAKNASASVDFGYFYGSDNLATLAAPSDATMPIMFSGTNGVANWATKNATKLLKLATVAADFDAISTAAAFNTAYPADMTTATTIANELAVDKVIAVQTAASTKALIKVVERVGEYGSTTGYIKITIKTVK